MASFWDRLFGTGKNNTPKQQVNSGGISRNNAVSPYQNNEMEALFPQTNPLISRASKKFSYYLSRFKKTGEYIGLPIDRLSRAEWDELNRMLEPHGIQLIELYDPTKKYTYMAFSFLEEPVIAVQEAVSDFQQLKGRASKRFDKYLSDFIKTGQSVGLPAMRLSDSQWQDLNKELASQGIKLVKRTDRGHEYMYFTRIQKSRDFKQASNQVKERAFVAIKQKYPNLPDDIVHDMVDGFEYLTTGDIYTMLRHSKNPYPFSEPEFVNGANYGGKSTSEIRAWEYQAWTWSRAAKNRVTRFDNNVLYHLSLNVHINRDLIRALDDILARDQGQSIYYYKFPKAREVYEAAYRHDPVTIYMYDRNPAVEQEIVRAVAPFVRSNDGLLGEILGPGVDINRETSNGGGMSVGQVAANKISRILSDIANGRE